jgi:hypothetical protein
MLNLVVYKVIAGPRRLKPRVQPNIKVSNQGLPNTTEDAKCRTVRPGNLRTLACERPIRQLAN